MPDFANTGGSVTLAVPYGCTADGRYAVGMNYRGQEKAVLWDTGDATPANWTVVDLTERATSEGILGSWTTLTRAFSVGTNSAGNPVVTGRGTYYDGSAYYNRAFVMVVSSAPAPAVQPRITSISGHGPGSVTVNYTNTMAGTNYTLFYYSNILTTNKTTVGSKTAAGTTDSQVDSTATGAPRFYRVSYTQ